MRNEYDVVVEVPTLKGEYHSDRLVRERGYAVNLDGAWYFFSALEPAYAFGRAGRMSLQVGSWTIVDAVTEVRFDGLERGDVRTLYLLKDASLRDHDAERDHEVLRRFADGVRANSAHWHKPSAAAE
ncbi:hypothetical protein [Arthrobacter sp. R-11]|uniref:hypothetical protein n=1 Tax=Arthrobacter sp. R-11 TaxID=3404053 RepID=UPI003CF2FD3F